MKKLPNNLMWLADAPLFIDRDQVHRFYDAVVMPEKREGTTTLEITEENAQKIAGKLNLEGTFSSKSLLGVISSIFPSLDIKAGAEVQVEGDETDSETRTIQFHPIHTPQRQLVQLTLHYLVNFQERLFLVPEPEDEDWRAEETIQAVPRELVFLDLPGQEEAHSKKVPETKIIPTAAEFENGKIDLIYERFGHLLDGELPSYPDKGTPEELMAARREYWNWFEDNFSATKAMLAVEEASKENGGKIRWIDYRVPISNDGHTLHLHICPAGEYDTGVLAYNFIKRGFKHGIRLIGTLKSEPDMNVLAIYEK